MKLRGKKLDEKNSEIVVFQRPSGPIVFTVAAVLNTSDFDKICPAPTPPKIVAKGVTSFNTDDARYLTALAERNRQYTSWLMIQTLSATPELEWEIVKADDPSTWPKWQDELTTAGLADGEIIYLIRKMTDVNGLNEARLDEARSRFLAEQAVVNPSAHQDSEQLNT